MVRKAIENLVDGPGSLDKYRAVWHSLQLNGVRVPRTVVQLLVREIDRKRFKMLQNNVVMVGLTVSMHFQQFEDFKFQKFCGKAWPRTS